MAARYRMRLLAVLLLFFLPAAAQQVQVAFDPEATRIGFVLPDVLHTVQGAFKLRRGAIWLDAGTGKAGGQLAVDAASGESGNHTRDNRMNRTVLQSANYPDITFTPDRFDGTLNLAGDSAIQLHGSFGIHGSAHELTMSAKSHIAAGRITADIDFDVPYVKWGMKDPSLLFLHVSDTVKIHVEGVGTVR
jgi:polyisoprenoid-binding protein YceI